MQSNKTDNQNRSIDSQDGEILDTPIGHIYVLKDDDELLKCEFIESGSFGMREKIKRLNDKELQSWFETSLKPRFDLYPATPLTIKVWEELLSIPLGTTISYSELAQKCGKPNAVRAVASAVGKNPFAPFVPCHRVIAKSGGIGGYAYGTKLKKKILAWEQKMKTTEK